MPRVVVDVVLKPEILDPQGQAIVGALRRLGVARGAATCGRASTSSSRSTTRSTTTTLDQARRHAARQPGDRELHHPPLKSPVSERAADRASASGSTCCGPCASESSPFPAASTTATPRARSASPAPRRSPLWHADPDLHDVDAVVLPGGFSYGDYLRCGAIARFSPVMDSVIDAARDGLPVLGICNGFQVLCEAHLLPGALIRNDHRKFVCRDQRLRVENATHGVDLGYRDGPGDRRSRSRTARAATSPTSARSTSSRPTGRVVVRYVGGNPNGSYRDIAGISNEAGNVVGLMPHPEHAVEALTGPGTDGLGFFTPFSSRRRRRQPASMALDTVEPTAAGRRREQPQPYAELGLADDEYARIREILGRRPTSSELAMYSVMWSEHCSYKSSQGAPAPVRREGAARPTRCSSAWARTPASSTSATAGRSPSRSSRTTTRPTSSRTRARPPASAASSATS